MSRAAPKIKLQGEFNDMGRYGEAVGWDLDFRQLEAGPLRAGASFVKEQVCMALAVNFNRSFHQVGMAPADRVTFGIPDVGLGEFNWCNSLARGGALLNFNLESGFEAISPAGFRGYTLSFERTHFQRLARVLGVHRDIGPPMSSGTVWHSPWASRLALKLDSVFREMVSGRVPTGAYSEFFKERIAVAVIRTLTEGETVRRKNTEFERKRALERALQIIHDCDNMPITVTELCTQADTSISTLTRGFVGRFGLTPKVYLRSRCLSAVRDDLAISPPETRVSEVANRWGFWHMGQFAADYRKMFGELPSETLNR